MSRQPQGQDDYATLLLLCSCRVTVLLLCSLFCTSCDCWVISHTLYKLLEKKRFYSILFYVHCNCLFYIQVFDIMNFEINLIFRVTSILKLSRLLKSWILKLILSLEWHSYSSCHV